MISKRIIPQFLLRGKRLVKGSRFSGPFIDVGDPLSQALINDAQGAEELALVDIDATREGRCIPPEVITSIINRCRLPLAVGGGVATLQDARRCFLAGADKIIVNTHAFRDIGFISALASEFGAQSVVVSMDVKMIDGKRRVVSESGTKVAEGGVFDWLDRFVEAGAGEIILTSVDHEGMLQGVDVGFYAEAASRLSVPLIAGGGFGAYDHIVDLFQKTQATGCALGKMLVLRDFDIIRIKAYLRQAGVPVRDA